MNTSELTRKQLHTRNIHCLGFERSDGLWDIEATLVDTKKNRYTNHERGEVHPGEPIHKMTLKVTLDIDLVIRDIQVLMAYTPYQLCKSASDTMGNLVGLKIEAGWMKEARQRVIRTESCTHVMELLGPISSTAYQTMHWAIEERENARPGRGDPMILDQCKTLARDSAIVKVMWPEFHKDNNTQNSES
jgi:hypothetical protein